MRAKSLSLGLSLYAFGLGLDWIDKVWAGFALSFDCGGLRFAKEVALQFSPNDINAKKAWSLPLTTTTLCKSVRI